MCETEKEKDSESASIADCPDDVSQFYQNTDNTQEAILSVFDLKEAEVRAYAAIIKYPDSTVKHIADDVLDRHRHHVSRVLRRLHETGLIKRRQKTFDNGGVGYIYSPIREEKAEQYFQNQLTGWLADLCSEINRLDGRIDVVTDFDEPLAEKTNGTGETTDV
jgi:predicted transcriptional regulator